MADQELGRLTLVIEGQIKDVTKQINDLQTVVRGMATGVEEGSDKAGKSWAEMAKGFIVGQFSVQAIQNAYQSLMNLFKDSLKEYDNEVVAVSRLTTALGDHTQKVLALAEERQNLTRFSADETKAAAQAAIMHKLNAEMIVKLIPVVQDFAARKGRGMVETMEAFTRAIQFGTTYGLRPYGIEIETTGSQQDILNQILRQGEGDAKDYSIRMGQLGEGPLVIVKNRISELKDGIGIDLQPAMLLWAETLESFVLPALSGMAEFIGRVSNEIIGLWALLRGRPDDAISYAERRASLDINRLPGGSKFVGPIRPETSKLGTTPLGKTDDSEQKKAETEKRALALAKIGTELKLSIQEIAVLSAELESAFADSSITSGELYEKKLTYINAEFDAQKKSIEQAMLIAEKESERERYREQLVDNEIARLKRLTDAKTDYTNDVNDLIDSLIKKDDELVAAGITNAMTVSEEDKKALEKKEALGKSLIDLGESIGRALVEGVTEGSKGLKEAFKSKLITVLSFLERLLIAAQLENALKKFASGGGLTGLIVAGIEAAALSGIFNLAKAGISKFSLGGEIGGRSHAQGGTLIEAERGEFITRKSTVDYYGAGIMNALNSRAIPKEVFGGLSFGRTASMAGNMAQQGGTVGSASSTTNATIVNYLDPALFRKFLATDEGKRAIVNHMSENRSSLQAVLGFA